MRFSCRIFLEDEIFEIPPDSRRYILSLIKEAFVRSSDEKRDFIEKLYINKREQKPFTFSFYYPMGKQNGVKEEFVSFTFSTNDYEFLMRCYNGLLTISKEKSSFFLFGSRVKEIRNFFLFPERRFDRECVSFKTLSPMLIRDITDGDLYVYPREGRVVIKNSSADFKYWREISGDEVIEKHLLSSMKSIVKKMLNIGDVFIDVKMKDVRVVPVLHGSGDRAHSYRVNYPGIKCILEIRSKPEVQKLFYDIGIGARRSEGFGMLEVVE